MVVYRYKYDEKIDKYVYRDEYKCQEDPEEPGSYLKPQHSTEIKPELNPKYITTWDDNRWINILDINQLELYDRENGSLVEDKSNISIYEMYKYSVDKPNYKFAKFDSYEENNWIPDIDGYKNYMLSFMTDKIEESQEKYADIILENGEIIEVNCCLDSLNSINSLIQYIEASGDINKTVNFRLYNNTMMNLGIDDLRICSEKVMDIYQNALQNKWKIKDDISSIKTFNEVEVYAEKNNIDIYLKDDNGDNIYPPKSIKYTNLEESM